MAACKRQHNKNIKNEKNDTSVNISTHHCLLVVKVLLTHVFNLQYVTKSTFKIDCVVSVHCRLL